MADSSIDGVDGRDDHRDQRPAPPTDSGAGEVSLFTGVAAVCDTAARLTGVDGAAVAVLTFTAVRELVHATDALSQQLDELQFVLGEGPFLDAYHHGEPQRCPHLDLGAAGHRWPAFAAEATDLGVGAVFAFPIPGPHHPVGVLELYRRTTGDLDGGGTSVRNGVCDRHRPYAAVQLGQPLRCHRGRGHGDRRRHRGPRSPRRPVHPLPGARRGGHDRGPTGHLHHRGPRPGAHSYANRRSIILVAADVVARRTSFLGHCGTPEEDR